MEPEWDENKQQNNLAKHGFDFIDARTALKNAHVLKIPSGLKAN
jgi:uncharacterized DUF497 family protein